MEAIFFIGLVIIAITQAIKYVAPKLNGAVTIVVAVLVGIVVALVDGLIGVTDISIAEGVVAGLTAVGITTTANKVGGN